MRVSRIEGPPPTNTLFGLRKFTSFKNQLSVSSQRATQCQKAFSFSGERPELFVPGYAGSLGRSGLGRPGRGAGAPGITGLPGPELEPVAEVVPPPTQRQFLQVRVRVCV